MSPQDMTTAQNFKTNASTLDEQHLSKLKESSTTYAPRCKNSRPQGQSELVEFPKLEVTYTSRKTREPPLIISTITGLIIAMPPDSPKQISSPIWDSKNGDDGHTSRNSYPMECYECQAGSCQVRMPCGD